MPAPATEAARRRHGRRPTAVLAALLAAAATWVPAQPLAAVEINRVVVRVNERIATLHDYRDRLGAAIVDLRRSSMPPERRQEVLQQLPENVFRQLFDEVLLLAKADGLRVEVTAAELDAAVARVREGNGIESDEELARLLAQQGKSWEQYRSELADSLRIQQVIGREVYSRIDLEEDDLRLYYRDHPEQFQVPEQRRLEEIVVLESSPLSESERLELAADLHARLAAGDDPQEAVAASAEAGTTSGVIDLDWVPAGDLDPALEGTVTGLEPGQWSPPVGARGGLHLVHLVERQEARVRPFDEVKDAIYAAEQNRRLQEELPDYLSELEATSYVLADPPPEAAEFRRASDTPRTDPLDVFRRRGNDAEAAGEGPPATGDESDG